MFFKLTEIYDNFFIDFLNFIVLITGISNFATLSPTVLPSPVRETSKFSAACKAMLTAEETPEDHPDLKEIRRRVMSNMMEMVELKLL